VAVSLAFEFAAASLLVFAAGVFLSPAPPSRAMTGIAMSPRATTHVANARISFLLKINSAV
jgi:hypothetical protein